MKNIIIRPFKDSGVTVSELYELRIAAFHQWTEHMLDISEVLVSMEVFQHYLKGKMVFVAQDEATGELLAMHTLKLNKQKGRANGANLAVSPKAKHEGIASQMLHAEAQRLRKNGYRYIVENTANPPHGQCSGT